MDNKQFRAKWKNIPLTPVNVDEYLTDLGSKFAGDYITQGVSFNKQDPYQMDLLRQALLTHGTFSGFIKHMMSVYFNQQKQQNMYQNQQYYSPLLPQTQRQNTFSTSLVAPRQIEEEPKEVMPEVKVENHVPVETTEEKKVPVKQTIPDKPTVNINKKDVPVRTTIRSASARKNNPFLQSNPNAKPPTEK